MIGAATTTSVPSADRHGPTASVPKVDLMGVSLAAITERQCIEHVLNALRDARGGWVVTPNLDILRRCVSDSEARAIVAEADLAVADGMPLIWASRLQGTPLPERVAGSSLVFTLTQAAAAQGRSVFLLGGDPGVADEASAELRRRIPGVRVVGVHSPPLGFERDESEFSNMRTMIERCRPDIVYVALGFPKQERLISRLRSAAPDAWWLGVGISFSFLCGQVRRAPRWMQRAGLEWVHRLLQEPRRLAKRYLVHGAPFGVRLLATSAARRFTRPAPPIHPAPSGDAR